MMRATLLMIPLLLSACSLIRPTAPESPPQEATTPPIAAVQNALQRELEEGGHLYRVDAAASDLRIYVFRGGRAPTMGKNHVIPAPSLQGFVALHSDLPTDAHFALGLHLDRLELDPPALRAQTGGSFAKPLTQEQIEGTRDNVQDFSDYGTYEVHIGDGGDSHDLLVTFLEPATVELTVVTDHNGTFRTPF